MQYCVNMYNKAHKLNVLNENSKIDRALCISELEKFNTQRQFDAYSQIVSYFSQTRKSKNEDLFQSQKECLNTDQIFEISHKRFS